MTPLLKTPKVHRNANMTAPVRTLYVRQPFRKYTGNSGLKNAIYPTFTSIRSCGTRQHYKCV